VTKSTGDACRVAGLRRAISSLSLRLEQKNEKEKGEEILGYL
jgi:hypothetical protein